MVLHDALQHPAGAAQDLLAMTATDITRWGGLPCVMTNVLDVDRLGSQGSPEFQWFVDAIQALAQAARKINVVLLKGETAELGACIGSDNPQPNAPFNWNASMTGLIDPARIIYGKGVKAGDTVIALREYGFRSNGLSSVRAALKQHYGPDAYNLNEARADLEAAAVPSVLYDKVLTTANGWYNPENGYAPLFDVRLIAHLTGGGLGKFAELLQINDLQAVLNDLYEPPAIMQRCGQWRRVSDQEFYQMWNGGQGALLVVPPAEAEAFVGFASSFGIESQICGEIVPSGQPATVTAHSKYKGGVVYFN